MKHLNWFSQLKLLLWKNTKLQSRSIISTILEIAIPAFFAIILLPIRTIVNSDQYLNNTEYPAFNVESFPDGLQPSFFIYRNNKFEINPIWKNKNGWSWSLAYCPSDSSKINQLMAKVAQDLNLQLLR